MKKLLIVDDEPYTVDGLQVMLSEMEDLELELYTAYSADGAIDRMIRTKVDIVLSDIRMPGMDGLELQRWVSKRWPRCKVIFLTGHGDIQYAQQAIRGGSMDYILKTEGDEAIVKSIRGAMAMLEEEEQSDQFLLKARQQLSQTIPVLRKEWFMDLLDMRTRSSNLSERKFEELNVHLTLQEKVLLVGGRVDRWGEGDGLANQALLLYAIQNIAEEYLERLPLLTIILEGSEFVWLLQPNTEQGMGEELDFWSDTTAYVLSALESIQATCRSLLKVTISLVCTGKPSAWDEIGTSYSRIGQTMVLGIGSGEEMLIASCEEEPAGANSDVYRRNAAELERYLEANSEAEFNQYVTELFHKLPNIFNIYAQIYYSIVSLLLGQINKLELGGSPVSADSIDRLLYLTGHRTKEQAVLVLKETAAELFEQKRNVLDDRTHRVIGKLNAYIREHLSEDLSLDVLADQAYMNASYLSSLYKQFTGMNISDYIAELRVGKAKELLTHSPLKIHEIAAAVGYGTAGYFTRYFKKHVGMTPQEYRN
ncbi:response regulator transcription factor [Paenibacillus sp. YIM B09110]|uniref:response regulator transcription factor n=1 Tax=Paenibacillus sp. YIM B09110 TaxID=3126102 RepID=UPI00301B79E7